jgi:hypothetical protein
LASEREHSPSSQNSPLLRFVRYILLGAFWAWIFSKLHTPNENGGKSVSQADMPYQEIRDGQTKPAVISQNPLTSLQQNRPSARKDAPMWEKWAAIAVAAGTIGLLLVNIYQMRSTEKAAVAARSAADTAERSFALAKRHAEDTDEATCSVRPDIELGGTFETISISNSGKSNARNLSVHMEVSQNTFPDNKIIFPFQTLDIASDEIRPNASIVRRLIIPNIDWQQLYKRRAGLVVSGTIQYDNGFDRLRRNEFCEAILIQPGRDAIPSMNLPPQAPSGIEVSCDRFPEFYKTWNKRK